MSNAKNGSYLTTREAAAQLQIREADVFLLVETGDLPCVRLISGVLVLHEDVAGYALIHAEELNRMKSSQGGHAA